MMTSKRTGGPHEFMFETDNGVGKQTIVAVGHFPVVTTTRTIP